MKSFLGDVFLAVYGDDDTVPAGTGNDTLAAGNADDPTKNAKTTFTQDEVNKMLAEDKRKHKAQVDKTVQELESLKKSKALTEKERETLQGRIDELQNSILTKEQLAAKERERLETDYKKTLESVTTERDTWQNRFVKSTINGVIISEAAKAEAFDADALIAILGANVRVAQELDADGNPIEAFVPKVKFTDTDKDGKPVTLDLTVEQTIKRMKEIPKYGYLFKSTAGGGLGAKNNAGAGDKIPLEKMTPEQWREYRKKAFA